MALPLFILCISQWEHCQAIFAVCNPHAPALFQTESFCSLHFHCSFVQCLCGTSVAAFCVCAQQAQGIVLKSEIGPKIIFGCLQAKCEELLLACHWAPAEKRKSAVALGEHPCPCTEAEGNKEAKKKSGGGKHECTTHDKSSGKIGHTSPWSGEPQTHTCGGAKKCWCHR